MTDALEIGAEFKQTKIGPIPVDWVPTTFGDLVTFSGGAQPPRSTFVDHPKEGYIRLIQTRDYKSDRYLTFIPVESARKKCDKNDVMIGRYGPPVFQILRGLTGAYNVALIKAIPNEEILYKEYLFYYISQHSVWAFIENLSQRSGGQTGVDLDQLRRFHFPLPPLPEQKKIAEILSTVDDKVDSIEQEIERVKTLKKGLMQKLLTGQISVTGTPHEFKDSKLGRIPENWEVVKISEYIEKMKSGISRKIVTQDIGIPVLISGNIQNSRLDTSSLKYWFKEDPQGANVNDYLLEDGDILLCFINSVAQIGKLCIFEDIGRPCIYTTNVFRIKAKHKCKYLAYLMSSGYFQSQIQLITKPAVNQASFTKADFLTIDVLLPPLPEQEKIASILSGVDDKLDILEEKKGHYSTLKKGLMQKLLTGKIRVRV